MSDDLHYLLWDISAYSCHADLSDAEKENLGTSKEDNQRELRYRIRKSEITRDTPR